MAILAQRLPVAFIPEQLLITAMWYDMINHRRRCDLPALHALIAQRIALQEAGAGFSPAVVIATGFRAAAHTVG